MLVIPRATVQVRIQPLILHGRLELPLVEADRPTITLLRDADGRASWETAHHGPSRPLKLPPISHLIIRDGTVSYVDEARRIRFYGTISSNEEGVGSARGVFALEGSGKLKDAPFRAYVHGGPLLHVDAARPYVFIAGAQAGDTRLELDGRIDHPFNFAALSGRLDLSGPDLADLYAITGLALPNTPPYALSAGFARRGRVYALQRISGRVGESDLSGVLAVDDTSGRPVLTADLASRRLRLADAVAVIGGSPRRARPRDLSPLERVEGARLRAEHRWLPDSRLDISRVRGMDARVTYRATQVDAGRVPMRDLGLKIGLDHGLLTIDPLTVDLAQGRIEGMIRIDARRAVPMTAIDLRLADAQLASLFRAKGPVQAIEGGLWARVALSGPGASIREAAAHADGSASLVVPGGAMRKTLASLLSVSLDHTAFLLITKNRSDTPIRCAVADFTARNGVLTADRFVLDTGSVRADGSGDIDLRDETLNLRLRGKPKTFSLLHLNAPITFTGPLGSPKAGIDMAKAIPQGAGAIALGVLATPVAAILPFVSAGLAKNADCQALTAATAPARRRHGALALTGPGA
jgi:uncharacterized protein involved in outer membrane biogenesis